jgi:hypothetical protein
MRFFIYSLLIVLLFLGGKANAVIDYSGKNISDYDFTTGELAELDLREGLFNGLLGAANANFTGRDLSNASFWNAINTTGNAEGAIFRCAILFGVDFTRTYLKNADFTGAYIGVADVTSDSSGTSFYGLLGTNDGITQYQLESTQSWKDGNLNGVRFGGSIIRGWSFSGLSLIKSAFNNSVFDFDVEKATYSNPIGAVLFLDANLENADFTKSSVAWSSEKNTSGIVLDGANLSGANLTSANFSHVDFSKTKNLTNANFTSTNLSYANFYGANLKGAKISADTNFIETIFDYADVGGMDFSMADLSSVSLNMLKIDGYYVVDPSENMILETDLKRTVLNLTAFTKDVVYNTRSYKIDKTLRLVDFSGYDLAGWDFSGIDLTGTKFNTAKFSDTTIFSGATLGVWSSFYGAVSEGFTFSMLKSTASWNDSLRGIRFGKNDFRTGGWDFSNQDLRDTDWRNANVANVSFKCADLRGVDRIANDMSSALYYNTIYVNGVVLNYSMSQPSDIIIVRPHPTYAVIIDENQSISGGAILKYLIDTQGKNFKIKIGEGKFFTIVDANFELWLCENFEPADISYQLLLSETAGIVYSGECSFNVYNADGTKYLHDYNIVQNATEIIINFVAIPEPSTFVAILGLIAMIVAMRRKNKV